MIYERPRGAAPLSGLLARLRRKRRRPPPLSASSPLVRHWLREALTRLAEVDGRAAHGILDAPGGAPPLGAGNFWVCEHGAAAARQRPSSRDAFESALVFRARRAIESVVLTIATTRCARRAMRACSRRRDRAQARACGSRACRGRTPGPRR